MLVSVHELLSQHSPVDPTTEPILSASSSVYSSDDKEVLALVAPTTTAPAPTPASIYKKPSKLLHQNGEAQVVRLPATRAGVPGLGRGGRRHEQLLV